MKTYKSLIDSEGSFILKSPAKGLDMGPQHLKAIDMLAAGSDFESVAKECKLEDSELTDCFHNKRFVTILNGKRAAHEASIHQNYTDISASEDAVRHAALMRIDMLDHLRALALGAESEAVQRECCNDIILFSGMSKKGSPDTAVMTNVIIPDQDQQNELKSILGELHDLKIVDIMEDPCLKQVGKEEEE